MHPFSKLMIAIKSKYPKIDDTILRQVLKRPEMLCREQMFVMLNVGDTQYHLITLKLINKGLQVNGDYGQCYKKIVDICFENAHLVYSLNKRFKKLKAQDKVVRLTKEEFKNFIINNCNQSDSRQVHTDTIDVNKPLNIRSVVEQTKGQTVVTDQEELLVAKLCAIKL